MTGPEDERSRPKSNLLSQTSDFIDRNIRVVKYCSVYGLAGVGVILILRSTYALRKFRSVKDIPADFIRLHARLHGDVVGVTETGRLLVNHAPVVTIRRLSGPASEGRLPITLAGTELNHLAFPWLEKNILNKHIWFTILRVGADTQSGVITHPPPSVSRDTSDPQSGVITHPPPSVSRDTSDTPSGVITHPPPSVSRDTSDTPSGVITHPPPSVSRDTSDTPSGVITHPPPSVSHDTTHPKDNTLSGPDTPDMGISDSLIKDNSYLKINYNKVDKATHEGATEDFKGASNEKSLVKLDPEEVLECIITAKKGFLRKMVVNEEVIRLGLAKVSHIDGLEGNREVTKLMTLLVKAEVKAEKKGVGIWSRPSLMERIRSYPTDTKNRIFQFLKHKFSWRSTIDDSNS